MGKFSSAAWANTMILSGMWCSIFAAVATGIQYTLPEDEQWPRVIYYCITLVFFPWHWPIEALGRLRILNQFYIVNGLFWIGISIYPFLSPPGFLVGFCYAVGGLLYLIAALRREKRLTLEELKNGVSRE